MSHGSSNQLLAATLLIQHRCGRRFKLFLGFFQVWAVRESVYGFNLPAELGGWLSVFDVLSLDLGLFVFPSWTCLGGLTTRLFVSAVWPLLLMTVVIIVLLVREAVRKTCVQTDIWRAGEGSVQRALMRGLASCVFISFCVLPSVTRTLFLAFQCDNIGYDDLASNGAPKTRSYLTASLNVEVRPRSPVISRDLARAYAMMSHLISPPISPDPPLLRSATQMPTFRSWVSHGASSFSGP